MREIEDGRTGRTIDDRAIDEVAAAMVGRQPAAGFGRRVVARIDEAPSVRHHPGMAAPAFRLAAAALLLGLAASLLPTLRPARVREPSPDEAAVRTPLPVHPVRPGPEVTSTPAGAAAERPTSVASRPARARAARQADRLWAGRSMPETERLVVSPVGRPDPVTVEPVDLRRMAIDDLAIEPLAVDALPFERRDAP
jgi:hypothetical protein